MGSLGSMTASQWFTALGIFTLIATLAYIGGLIAAHQASDRERERRIREEGPEPSAANRYQLKNSSRYSGTFH